ncbi:Ribosomal RNA-processing protein 7 [Yarrowia sp. B02]|nr:Ribosomal RNA-processing protein 7 [Yarrowia sp. B02]
MSGYEILPLKMPKGNTHYLYLKKDDNSAASEDSTIFAVNLPADTTLSHIKALCQSLGNSIVEGFEWVNVSRNVRAESLTHGLSGGCGRISMVDAASCNRVLSQAKKHASSGVKWDSKLTIGGKQRYQLLWKYCFPAADDLQAEVDYFMEEFAAREEEDKQVEKSGRTVVDADGFTTVVKTAKKKSLAMQEAAKQQAEEMKLAEIKRREKREKKDFYRFQIREYKKEQMTDMLTKFKEDQEKVKQYKESGRFNPY